MAADGPPHQVVEPTAELPFLVSMHPDCTSASAREGLVQQVMATERAALSDLECAPLLRIRVLQFGAVLGADEHTLLLTIHHIIEDGWSLRLLLDAVAHGYNTPGVPLFTPPSYEVKLRHEAALSAVPGSASEVFWQQAVHSLPSTARSIPAVLGTSKMSCSETATAVATRRRCVLDSAVLQRLRTLAVQERLTIAALCHTAWAIVQWAYEGADADEVVFGCALSGRTAPVPQLAQVIGPVMNTVPLRVALVGAAGATATARALHRQLGVCQLHESYPLTKIKQLSSVRDGDLFFVIVDYQSAAWGFELDGGVSAAPPTIHDRIGMPLTVRFAMERGSAAAPHSLLSVVATSESDAHDGAFLEGMLEAIVFTLTQLAASPLISVGEIARTLPPPRIAGAVVSTTAAAAASPGTPMSAVLSATDLASTIAATLKRGLPAAVPTPPPVAPRASVQQPAHPLAAAAAAIHTVVSPPTTETELQLAAAFAAVFKLDGPTAIDLDAHFFQLGGDSLLCLRLVQVRSDPLSDGLADGLADGLSDGLSCCLSLIAPLIAPLIPSVVASHLHTFNHRR